MNNYFLENSYPELRLIYKLGVLPSAPKLLFPELYDIAFEETAAILLSLVFDFMHQHSILSGLHLMRRAYNQGKSYASPTGFSDTRKYYVST